MFITEEEKNKAIVEGTLSTCGKCKNLMILKHNNKYRWLECI